MKALILLVFICSCANTQKPEKKFKKLLAEGKCEEASINIPNFEIKKVSAQLASVPGKTISYILTSGAMGVDLIYFISKGVIIPAVACAPLGILSSVAGSSPDYSGASINCFSEVSDHTWKWENSSFGDKTYEGTSGLRCPNFDFAVDQILEVVKCYERTDQKQKAKEQLWALSDPKALGGCVADKHLTTIELQKMTLEN